MTDELARKETSASLIAAAAHDLRQPLQAMNLLTSTLILEPDDHMRGEVGERMTAAIGSLQAMLDLLIDIARMESAGLPAAEPCDLDPLLRACMPELTAVAAHRGGTVTLAENGVRIETSPRFLREAVRGLVLHAVWLQPSASISIAAQNNAGNCTVEILAAAALPDAGHQRMFTDLPYRANDRLALSVGMGLRFIEHVAGLLGFALVIEPAAGPGTRLALVAKS